MLVYGLLLVVVLLAGMVAIRSRAPERPASQGPAPDADLTPERRLWEIWKRLGWAERLTMLALVIGGLGAISLGLFGLVVLVW